MNIRLFNFTHDDYVAVTQIWNAAFPEYKDTVEELKKRDEERPGKIVLRRYMFEHDGDPIGYGVFYNSEDTYHPQEFWINPTVQPSYHGRGYGKALYGHMMRELKPYRPTLLKSWSREDFTRKTRFLQDRGFEEKMRSFESRLDVLAFDPAPFENLEKMLRAKGVELKTYADLAADPERDRKIYDLHITLDRDVPMTGEYTKPTFERFASYHWGDERFVPEGYLVAVAGDKYVGLSELFVSKADDKLHTGLTGVLRAYRRKGIALALKVKGARFARELGAPEINTWNESNNRPMLNINERLGFVRQPASIDFVKKLGD